MFTLLGISFSPLGIWLIGMAIIVIALIVSAVKGHILIGTLSMMLGFVWAFGGLLYWGLTTPPPPPAPIPPTPTPTPTPVPNTTIDDLQIFRTYHYTTREWQTYADPTADGFYHPPENVVEVRNLHGVYPQSQSSGGFSGGGIAIVPPAIGGVSGSDSSFSGMYEWEGLTVVRHDVKVACRLEGEIVTCDDSGLTADQINSVEMHFYAVLYQPSTGNAQTIEVDFDTFKKLTVGQYLTVLGDNTIYWP